MSLSIDQSTLLCRLLADASRQRILLLLEAEALSVAELTEVTGLSQGRISTHLSRLRGVGLVRDERVGSVRHFRADTDDDDKASVRLWKSLRSRIDDPQTEIDRARATEAVRRRHAGTTWAETVAGRMERHYSPGRSWEANARALLGLLQLGDVLDIGSGDGVLAELLVAQSRSFTCLDISARLLGAARNRLQQEARARFVRADMNRLPFADASFDQVLLMHALTYTRTPEAVIADAARLLRPGGTLLVATLESHSHDIALEVYDHLNHGMSGAQLRQALEAGALQVDWCEVACQEGRPPYFRVLVARARRRAAG